MINPPAHTPPEKRPSSDEVAAPPAGATTLTFGETAYLLRVSVSTVRRLIGSGQIEPSSDLGPKLISREAVDVFVERARSLGIEQADAKAQAARLTSGLDVGDSGNRRKRRGRTESP